MVNIQHTSFIIEHPTFHEMVNVVRNYLLQQDIPADNTESARLVNLALTDILDPEKLQYSESYDKLDEPIYAAINECLDVLMDSLSFCGAEVSDLREIRLLGNTGLAYICFNNSDERDFIMYRRGETVPF